MITQEKPKRLAPQHCPLCNEPQDIIANGHYPIENNDVGFDKDRGYSFCNCRNIFFTDWSNINQMVYDQDYVKKYDHQHMSQVLQNYFHEYHGIIAEYNHAGKFLEIGCINPALLDIFNDAGYQTYALDIMKHDVGSKHKFIEGNFEELTFADQVDVVWASHVFEHFRHPLEAINKCHALLNANGLLFVAMPDPYFLDFHNIQAWQHFHLNEHHIMWDLDSFCEALEERGFEILIAKHNTKYEFICIGDFHVVARKK
jgi:SAM-dependent methyltransferase